jgi:condensin complex subunit 1
LGNLDFQTHTNLSSKPFFLFFLFQNTTLRAVATLSFSKFLCVSSQFCDANHQLLSRILETSRDANIRSNIAIALGDVAVSFSTIVDENSDELYKGLSDQGLVVKKNTLMVLTHLILNGIIKVKGQLGEMAKCLEDKEPRIAGRAKLFFIDLSTKDNAIPARRCVAFFFLLSLFRACAPPRPRAPYHVFRFFFLS